MRSLIFIIILSFGVSASVSKMGPTKRVYETIEFSDDLNFDKMIQAIDRQIEQFSKLSNLKTKFKLGTLFYTRQNLKDSLVTFKQLVVDAKTCLLTEASEICYRNLSDKVNKEFAVYKPKPAQNEAGYATGQTLFTSYYSPDLDGSKVKTEVYKNPIYAMPKKAELRGLSREQIDYDGKLSGMNLELFYVKESHYDIWLLHVEGGGRVKVTNEDGTNSYFYLSYAGTNKLKFNMIYKYMNEHGMLEPGKTSISHQRQYLEDNPADERAVMSSCPSYVYFKVTHDEPLGVRNIPLTENRSLATDYRKYQEYGLINFIQTKKPVNLNEAGEVVTEEFSRFMINQDTGGAIKGNARSDLYFGFGKKAEFVANHLMFLGNQYFLIKKNEEK
jgi:membrane-bound lytic murein transglycosylase A